MGLCQPLGMEESVSVLCYPDRAGGLRAQGTNPAGEQHWSNNPVNPSAVWGLQDEGEYHRTMKYREGHGGRSAASSPGNGKHGESKRQKFSGPHLGVKDLLFQTNKSGTKRTETRALVTKVFTGRKELSNPRAQSTAPARGFGCAQELSGPAGRIGSVRECKGPQHPNSAQVLLLQHPAPWFPHQ